MNILVLNAGSSSIKFQLIHMPSENKICSGIVERIGLNNATINYSSADASIRRVDAITNHKDALKKIVALLLNPEIGVIKSSQEIDAVGHRVVHGGGTFAETTIISDDVKREIEKFVSLAPLHNPHNLEGISIAQELFPDANQVAVFDTAFHQTMPIIARKYALPNELYNKHGIQAYGFHGTSHKYVAKQAIDHYEMAKSKMISIHLGNGCSMTAIVNGKSIDHSLGFGPSNGLVMGTRSGDIDHTIIFHLVDKMGYTLQEISNLVTKKSGMLGLTGYSDLRDIQHAAASGNHDCQEALEMNAYRIKKYIGAYTAAMNGLDVVIFTAGIGENSGLLRRLVCADLEYIGLELCDERNKEKSSVLREINTQDSKVKILVIPTNEELEIAKQTYAMGNP